MPRRPRHRAAAPAGQLEKCRLMLGLVAALLGRHRRLGAWLKDQGSLPTFAAAAQVPGASVTWQPANGQSEGHREDGVAGMACSRGSGRCWNVMIILRTVPAPLPTPIGVTQTILNHHKSWILPTP